MADKYSTIQQHQPLRVPASFDKYGKALVLQIDEIFDDIYRRFGRIRVDDLGKNLQNLILIEGDDGNYVSVQSAIDGIQIDVQHEIDGKISKTSSYQTADSIVSAAEAYADGHCIAKTTVYQDAASIVSTAEAYADGHCIAKTTTYQDAASIVTAAENYADGHCIAKTTTYQDAASIVTTAEAYTQGYALQKTTTYQTAQSIVNTAESYTQGYALQKTTTYPDIASVISDVQSYARGVAGTAETNAKNASILRTATYQDAASIVTVAEAYADTKAGAAETNAKNASILRTSTYQDAASIVTAAQTYTNNQLTSYSTTSQTSSMISTAVATALGDYSTTSQTASMISTYVGTALGDYSTTSQTSSMISSAISTALGDYSTTQQTAAAISAAVGDCYGKVSSISITSSGIEITGGNYVKIKDSNSNTAVLIDGDGIDMQTAGKAYIHAKDSSNSAIIFGTSASSAVFSVGMSGDVSAASVSTNSLTVGGVSYPPIVVSASQPSGSGKIWVKPDSSTQKQWSFTPANQYMDSSGGTLGYYRDYTVSYSASDYLSGNLYYGVTAKLIAFSLSSARNITLKARLQNGNNWIDIGSVTTMCYSAFSTVTLDVMMSSAAANVMSISGGSFTLRLETDYDPTRCRLDGSVTLKAKSTSSSGVSACSVFYLS